MIAAHNRRAHGEDGLANLIRAGVVADNVSQVHQVVVRRGSSQTSLQRLKVGVDITQ